MATLQAAWDVKKAEMTAEKEGIQRQRPRNVADPSISVEQLSKTLEGYMRHSKCSDLWRLVCPPPSLPALHWHSPVNAEWVVKLCPLAFDVFGFAKNTKVQSVRLRKALADLHEQRVMELPHGLGSKDDCLDRMDLTLRIGFTQFATLKKNPNLRTKVERCLTREEQFKLDLVLEKVYMPVEDCPEQLAICDVPRGGKEKEPEPKAKQTMLRRSFQFSASALLHVSEVPEMPDIFKKILKRDSVPEVVPKSPSPAFASFRSEEDLLQCAMAFVPQQLDGKKKKSEKKKSTEKKKGKNAKTKGKAKNKKGKKALQASAEGVKGSKKEAVRATKKHPGGNGGQPPSGDGAPTCPDYLIMEKPTPEDGYRNLYVSRHWHRARQLARRCGLSKDEQKQRAGKARKQTAAIWDEMHPN